MNQTLGTTLHYHRILFPHHSHLSYFYFRIKHQKQMKLPVLLIPYHTLSWLGGRRPVSGCVSVTAQYGVRTRVEKGKGTDTDTTGKFRRPGPTLAPALGAGGNLNSRRRGRGCFMASTRGGEERCISDEMGFGETLGGSSGSSSFSFGDFYLQSSQEVLTEEGRR